jgi:diguanylate cyclase (GGDEF)-like protein
VPRIAKKTQLDASPHGLMRLYCRILLSAGMAVFILHGVIGFLTGFGDRYGPVLIGMDAVLVLLGFMSNELVVNAQLQRDRRPRGWLLACVGFYLVVLTSETGGLASPFIMLLLVTCVFAALIMSGLLTVLLTATIAALHAAAAWLLPGGILRDGLEGIESAALGGRSMALEEVTGIAMHSAFLFLGAYIASKLSRDFRTKVSTLTNHATRDPLTKLPNRRGFEEKMHHEIARAERYAWPIAILMLDLDHFKPVNDKYGHAFGDDVLSVASQILRDTVGPVDHLARVGGEEFCVAAVAADPNHGADLAQRILRRFREHPWSDMKPDLAVTCSIGVAALDTSRASSSPDASLSQLMDKADQALYHVKENGRDNYHVADAGPVPVASRPQLRT